MGGGSKKQTVGYWYKLLYHAGLSKGPIDAFLEFRGGDRTAWQGELTASGTINIDKPKLWGGTEEQGGIVSDVDVMFGEATQAPNAYLLANLGDQVPAWRGLATLVFKGGKYGAMNPYPQNASYKIRKIKQGWDGDCWYPEKAPIPGPGLDIINRLYIAMDKSLSLSTAQFNQMRSAMQLVIDGLQDLAASTGVIYDIMLVSFSGSYTSISRSPAQLGIGGAGWDDFRDWIASITQSAGTTAEVAFGPALDFFGGAWQTTPARNVAVVLSDGEMTDFATWSTTPAIMQMIDQAENPWSIAAGTEVYIRGIGIGIEGDLAYFDNGPDAIPIITGTDDQAAADLILSFALLGFRVWWANPAHALYFARTNSDMGREPTANINDASLTAAADTLYAEGFGICTTRDPTAESVEEFEQRICKLIDGAFGRDPITGQWHLDLARGDYVLDDLPILTDDDILEFKELPSTLDNAVNSVSVKYFDPERKETITTPPVQARALIAQFGTIHQTVDYPEIPTAGLAARVALRELRATATPTRALELVCTRKPGAWRVNTYFRLQTPKRGIADMVCIVGEKQSGNLKSGAIRLKATQDIYSMPATAFVDIEPGVDTEPPQTPLAIARQAAYEAPYVDVVTALTRADLAVLPSDVGYLATVAADPGRTSNYTVMVDAGAGYAETALGDWAPVATVVEAAGPADVAFTVATGSRLDEVETGSAALWGSEIVRIDALDVATGALTLGRGCADTVPVPHAAGEAILFHGGNEATDGTEYTDGETVDVKLLTNAGSQQLSLAAATAIPVAFDARFIRPYPPGQLRINGDSYPAAILGTYTLSWAHRDRIAQADQLVDTEMASIGPETGTTYTLRLYGETDTLLRTETGLTGTGYTWVDEAADSGLTVPDGSGYNYAAEVLADSPLVYYRLDEISGTTATDSSGNGHHGTYSGGVTLDQAPLIQDGRAVLLNGTSGKITGPAVNLIGDCTLEAWYTPSSVSGTRYLIDHAAAGETAATNMTYSVLTIGTSLQALWESGSGVNTAVSSGYALSVGTAYHIVVERDAVAKTVKFTINDTVVATVGYSNNPTDGGSGVLYVGAFVAQEFSGGLCDEVAVYDHLLGTSRVSAHYLAGTSVAPTGTPRLNGRVRCELESVRDGLTSSQKHNITVDRAGWGYQWGNYWGGLP